MLIVIGVILTRCMVIAFKYATFDPVKIEVIRNHPLTYEEIVSDFYLVDWFNQSDRVIHDETYFGLRVYDIDPGMFYVDFMVPPDAATTAKAKQYVEDLKAHHHSKSPFEGTAGAWSSASNSSESGSSPLFFGYAIMKHFTMVFQAEN